MSILDSFITSKMRIRVLMRLFLNPTQEVYIRELSDEFEASPAQVRDELIRLREADLLFSTKQGRQIKFKANRNHPLFPELHSMVKKSLGMDSIIESVLQRLGDLKQAYLIDDYAEGKDVGLVDLLLVGDIDRRNLEDLIQKTEKYICRKIRTLILDEKESKELDKILSNRPHMLLWERG